MDSEEPKGKSTAVQLAALTRLCRECANAETLEVIFAAAAEALIAGTDVTRVAVLALDDAGAMRFRAWRGLSDTYRQRVDGHSPWGADTPNPEPILIDDVSRDRAMAPFQAAFTDEGIGAIAFLPLLPRGELVGKFMLYADAPIAWAQQNLTYANAVADLLGSVLARERMHRRLARAREIERLGLLAGGIAHDFANVLTSIGGYAELARQETPSDSRARGFIDGLLRTVQQGSGLTQRLLPLAQERGSTWEPIDAAELLEQLLDTVRRCDGPPVDVQYTRDIEHSVVRASRSGLQRVILNLLANARDAMPAGGTLRIGVRRAPGTFGHEPARLEIEVTDSGIGMDEATQQRLFQPLFTTKSAGRGTGLGLATCYSIVVRLGGDIVVRSALGEGSTFLVRLPLIEGRQEATAAAS